MSPHNVKYPAQCNEPGLRMIVIILSSIFILSAIGSTIMFFVERDYHASLWAGLSAWWRSQYLVLTILRQP